MGGGGSVSTPPKDSPTSVAPPQHRGEKEGRFLETRICCVEGGERSNRPKL